VLWTVRYALACRDVTNQAGSVKSVNCSVGPGWLCHDKLKHIGHFANLSPQV
jgi:hypothetical protein